ncbi:lantibiotic ABC transporter [Cnuibacter physcomitrellae]|uniref:Lantibiotic ABC transporter n=1 Tax=Cnuibacter physcomitrellae TaxID=1619308 RepID=A0A1X9LLQ1_9MICO|nr:BtrH N-terminal domain-containing protein [Cnuibacter physcomitrellae]ARJ06136.1 lantibiotic ABC transporter [Cnuibacter physcomitrellae]GGI37298.1 lantibiotic ABC transporter [Cnuibacter physcomitrellae]
MTDETVPGGAVVVEGVPLEGGVHCETTTAGVLLGHAGLSLSEPLLFGLAGGLSFVYWDSKRQDVPFLGGRVKPFLLTQNLAARLGVTLRVQETASARKAWDEVRASIDEGVPVGLQLDSHDLEYFSSRVHFAGHIVALYGYDAAEAYLVDTAQQGGAVRTSLDSLARARAARGPMSARHRMFSIDLGDRDEVGDRVASAIVPAIADCAAEFLDPPIANVGHRGIRTAARRAPTWLDRVADPGRDLPRMSMMMERAGTGGALFRNLYRDFLTECLDRLEKPALADAVERGRDLVARSAELWATTAHLIDRAGTTLAREDLAEAAATLDRIADVETEAMTVLSTLRRA